MRHINSCWLLIHGLSYCLSMDDHNLMRSQTEMKTIIDDVECTDETSDGSAGDETTVQAAVRTAGAPGGGRGNNQKCLCTVNRNKTSEQTIMIGLGSMDEPCSKLEDVIRSKIHSVERLPRK